LKPRIEGYEHTAPAYDTVTQVTTAPVPAVCYLLRSDSGEDCRCQTQQGTRYATTDDVCRSIITNGFFNAYAPQAAPTVETHPAPPA
jgi:zona occludens toxin